MFKLTGSVMVLISSVILFSRKTAEYYYTYIFLRKAEVAARQILYEINSNLSYDKILKKIGFDKFKFLSDGASNVYILKNEYYAVENFFDNLGKRDSISEKEYIIFNLNNIKKQKDNYCKKYCETAKMHIVSGAAAGLVIIIFLI